MLQHRDVAAAAIIAVGLIASIGSVMITGNGFVMIGWGVAWASAAGVLGWSQRSWFWPVQCPLVMMALVMLWEILVGQTSWASMYVFMLGVVFAVTATTGSLIGVWLGRRGAFRSRRPSHPPTSARVPQ